MTHQIFAIKSGTPRRVPHFKVLSGDVNWADYGGMFVSRKMNNGDFNYWLVIKVTNMEDAVGDEATYKYDVELLCVSPEQAAAELPNAFRSCGIEEKYQDEPLVQVEALASYGVFAVLWNDTGNNISKLMREAHKQAATSGMLFGFYMDAPQNRIGATGWDTIKGDLHGEAFRAYCAEKKAAAADATEVSCDSQE